MKDKHTALGILSGIIIVTLVAFFSYGAYLIHKLYAGIFRLSPEQVFQSFPYTAEKCKTIGDCKLLPGDILVRRYITNRTQLFDILVHPYFTHAAFYLGDGKIVEAVGTENNAEDEIQIAVFFESDWFDADMEKFAIIRPNYRGKLENIKSELEKIAEDTEYRFGLFEHDKKMRTCADFILQPFLDAHLVTDLHTPNIVTPDYLFWLGATTPAEFEIVGQGIRKQGLTVPI